MIPEKMRSLPSGGGSAFAFKEEQTTMKRKLILLLSCVLALCLALAGCGSHGGRPVVTLQFTDGSKIVMTLEPDNAPNTVANFVDLVEQGYYDGMLLHRAMAGQFVQGGDPHLGQMALPTFVIEGEFTANNDANPMKHERGTVSMARVSDDYNSASTQFFICASALGDLDGQYAAFGKVTDEASLEVVDKLCSLPTNESDIITDMPQIEKATVALNGYKKPDPERYPDYNNYLGGQAVESGEGK